MQIKIEISIFQVWSIFRASVRRRSERLIIFFPQTPYIQYIVSRRRWSDATCWALQRTLVLSKQSQLLAAVERVETGQQWPSGSPRGYSRDSLRPCRGREGGTAGTAWFPCFQVPRTNVPSGGIPGISALPPLKRLFFLRRFSLSRPLATGCHNKASIFEITAQVAIKRFTFAVKETLITLPAGEMPPLLDGLYHALVYRII